MASQSDRRYSFQPLQETKLISTPVLPRDNQ